MLTTITIADIDFTVDYDAKITAPAIAKRGPTYSSGGEPASPMEYEVSIVSLKETGQGPMAPLLALPGWLTTLIERHLEEREDIYNDVEREFA